MAEIEEVATFFSLVHHDNFPQKVIGGDQVLVLDTCADTTGVVPLWTRSGFFAS